MRIVSYNIHHCSQAKIDRLLTMDADVYIVPELSDGSDFIIPPQFDMLWVGNDLNKKKGLGVIYKKTCDCKLADWYNSSHNYALPFWSGKLLVLAMWPTKTHDNVGKSYPQIAMETLKDYARYFKGNRVFICGDFNCYVGQSGEKTSVFSITEIFKLLEQYDIHSLYHLISGEELGGETTPTFYFRFNQSHQFFIDYAFSNFAVRSFEIAKWDKEMSDHCALIAEF